MPGRDLEKTYDPHQVEERWYRFWTERGYFRAATDHAGAVFSIVIPPPNVTGSLHIGHALNNTLQDILVRWRRMQGRNTLWVPGTDHAGIATQNVVERQIREQEGRSREELGRERFIERVWEWKAQSGNTILEQLKRLGASCDWSRLRFTLDDGLSTAVREVFVRLYEDGLIYRGERLINWCPRCLTALSDIEVEHEQTTGKLYHIPYPLADDPAVRLTVATTRPETLLGDTAVAVHPEDDRYRHLIGRRVRLPLTTRAIPVVGDPILVDREFGSGVVKITPAHDFNDFDAGARHDLPRLALFDQHARLDADKLAAAGVDLSVARQLAGLTVHKARPVVEQLLKDGGFLAKVEPHGMSLGRCYRCKTIVEPYLSPQWFVKIAPLAEPAIKAVEDGRIKLHPESWTNNYLGWMREIKDWCISRQIWWGHQIPAWYCRACNKEAGIVARPDGTWIIPRDAQPIVAKVAPSRCRTCGGQELIRDPDVLDTWFSSALWPFSTLGWPERTPDLATYYPTTTLVTGFDILFFWVARMIMMGLKFMGDVPFRDVYIHALVRDAEGQKMSKSKGNVIDPLVKMEEYGSDALRFTLASMASPGRDIKLAEDRIEGYRNFANKLWNAARFLLLHLDGATETTQAGTRSFADRWILSRLHHTIAAVNDALESYRFDQACHYLYQFLWHEYCDWYLEMIKPVLSASTRPGTARAEGPALPAPSLVEGSTVEGPALQAGASSEASATRQTLVESFEVLLRLLHPMMPFITEEIWQALPHRGDSITVQPYPTSRPEWESKDAEMSFALLERFVTTARNGRVLLNYPPGKTVTLFGTGRSDEETACLGALVPLLHHLSRGTVDILPLDRWPRRNVLRHVVEGLTIGLAVEGDVAYPKVLAQIKKQQDENKREALRVEGKLSSTGFTSKAPPEVVAEHRQRLQRLRQDQALLQSSEEQLRTMMESRG